jgi:DNA-binding GntR family transcriptional regulator
MTKIPCARVPWLMVTSATAQCHRRSPRDPVPSESQLQQEHGVSRGTIRRTLDILRDEGLVVTIAGRGTFVKPRD